MAYDEGLAQRIREILADLQPPQLVEKKMFGGVIFMAQGNMACGASQDNLLVRVGQERHAAALSQPHTRISDCVKTILT